MACIRRRQRLVIVSGYGQMYQYFVQTVLSYLEELRYARYYQVTIQAVKHTIVQAHGHVEMIIGCDARCIFRRLLPEKQENLLAAS